jgi:hypothetical protein
VASGGGGHGSTIKRNADIRSTTRSTEPKSIVRIMLSSWEPPIGIEPMTYALRACSGALLVSSKLALASCSQVAIGGHRWPLMVVRGHLGGTRVSNA